MTTMKVNPIEEITQYHVIMTPDEARGLYRDLQNAFTIIGVDFARNRPAFNAPELYALYDQLYAKVEGI